MAYLFFVVGTVTGGLLVGLLIRTWCEPEIFRIWPTPGPGSWQNPVFWTLFRTLNVAAIGNAVASSGGMLDLPEIVRFGGLCLLFGALALYVSALLALGKANTYCEAGGLVTRGIYRWTRNPQYATIIPLYVGLAIAADSAQTTVLCAGLIAVYILMAVVEEPWLESAYGEPYRRYRQRVPRFFNWHRAWVLAQWMARVVLLKPLLRHEEAVRSVRSDRRHG